MLIKKYFKRALPVIFFSATAAFGQDAPVAIFSYTDISCGQWVNSSSSESARAQYVSWFRGFVSGYNFGNPNNQVLQGKMPDEQTLFLFVDKYCHDNPLNPFVSAGFKLVEELRVHSVPKKAKSR
jgi:hypothetical protein